MNVRLKLFSVARDIAGFDEQVVVVAAHADADAVLRQLVEYVTSRLAEIAARMPGGALVEAQIEAVVREAVESFKGVLLGATLNDMLSLAKNLKGPVRHDPVDLA